LRQENAARTLLKRGGLSNPSQEEVQRFRYWTRRIAVAGSIFFALGAVLTVLTYYYAYHGNRSFALFVAVPFILLGLLVLRWYSNWLQRKRP